MYGVAAAHDVELAETMLEYEKQRRVLLAAIEKENPGGGPALRRNVPAGSDVEDLYAVLERNGGVGEDVAEVEFDFRPPDVPADARVAERHVDAGGGTVVDG